MALNTLGKKVWEDAKKKGFKWDTLSPLENHALITTEIAEATEAVREGLAPVQIVDGKPGGEAIELADVVMRVAGYCAAKGIDLDAAIYIKHAYNLSRPPMHGGKKL